MPSRPLGAQAARPCYRAATRGQGPLYRGDQPLFVCRATLSVPMPADAAILGRAPIFSPARPFEEAPGCASKQAMGPADLPTPSTVSIARRFSIIYAMLGAAESFEEVS